MHRKNYDPLTETNMQFKKLPASDLQATYKLFLQQLVDLEQANPVARVKTGKARAQHMINGLLSNLQIIRQTACKRLDNG